MESPLTSLTCHVYMHALLQDLQKYSYSSSSSSSTMETPPPNKKVVNNGGEEEGTDVFFDKFLSQCGRLWYLDEECDNNSNSNKSSSYYLELEEPKLDILDLLFPLCETIWDPDNIIDSSSPPPPPPPPPFGLDTIQEEEKEGGENNNKNNGNGTTIYKYFEFSHSCNQSPCDCGGSSGGGYATKEVDEKREEEEESMMDTEEEYYGILKDMFPPDFRDAHSTGRRSAFLTRESLG